jgi:hypothetical protein
VPVDEGRLKQSLDYEMRRLGFRIGSVRAPRDGKPVVYAAMVNFGGTIKPKNAKMLAWPLPGGPVPKGTTARDAIAHLSQFGATGWFILPNKKAPNKGHRDKPVIYFAYPDGSAEPAFVLARSVKRDPTYFLTGVVNDAAIPRIVDAIDRRLSEELGKV